MQLNAKSNIQTILNECEASISSLTNDNIRIKHAKQTGLLNGVAHSKQKYIELRGYWSDLLSTNAETAYKARIALYYVIGHELGHMDNEPSKIIPSNCVEWFIRALLALIRKDFRSQIRELRADYCGIIFAMQSIEGLTDSNRIQVIEDCFDYEISKLGKNKDKGDSMHPSFQKRKEILKSHTFFNVQLIQDLSKEYSCNQAEIKQLCSCAFNGQMFDLSANKIKQRT